MLYSATSSITVETTKETLQIKETHVSVTSIM